jgi:adenosine deaminase
MTFVAELRRSQSSTTSQTDDTLPFRTNLLAEYALLLAKPPLGLGLSREQISEIAATSLRASFRSQMARN